MIQNLNCNRIIFYILVFFSVGCKKDSSLLTQNSCNNPVFNSELPSYYQLFYRENGWTGGDAAYSIALSNDKTLWLFGDTWYGEICEGKHASGSTLPAHNTLAIQQGKDPATACLNYYFGKSSSENLTSFFEPKDGVGLFWPNHGIVLNNKLYIIMVKVDYDTNAIGFKLIGTWLLTIDNPLDPPLQWQVTQLEIPHALFSNTKDIIFGSYLLEKNGSVYIYGNETNHDEGNRYLYLAKVPYDSLTYFNTWKFYNNGQWVNDYNSSEKLTDKIGIQFSVSYQPKIGKYILVTTELGFSKNITIQYSDSLQGPWQAPITIYQCPEMDWDSRILCYAGNGHSELSDNDELIITYIANSLDFWHMASDSRLYYPRFLKIKF